MATGEINLRTTIKNSPETNANIISRDLAPQSDPRVGIVLDSKYELVERLGEGGMGAVYRARRLHIGDEVAVKLLSHDVTRDKQAIERFRREARSAALIRHPNVVSIHDFNDQSSARERSEAYIVMELVKGESLRHVLEREGRLAPLRAVKLMLDICAGVGVAHRQGLLHRDLKPDNVIVSPPAHEGEDETAKVVDFGLAKVRDEASPLTQTGTLMGTVYYMSPEQCRGEELDARTDVYSLGAMLYEMLSGAPPFRANNFTGLITKHLNEAPPTLDASLRLPTALSAVCFRCLAKSRDQRPADAIVLSRELQRALAAGQHMDITPEHAAGQPPAPVLPQKSKSQLTKWIMVGAGVSLIAVLLVGIGIGIKFGIDRLANRDDSIRNTHSQASQTAPAINSDAPSAAPNSDATSSTTAVTTDLRGTWTGTYGPMGNKATLVIKNHDGRTFDGVLEQGSIRVAFEGTIQGANLTMKQTKVLSGEGWNLGEDTGKISSDGERMSGTGKDEFGGSLGMTYPWSFSR
ncbi:MAG TPA: serine/threonine-protein kinase [Pyrinomonadaceae bacterium]|nr:serine/threonine-protein kinase [Pyrinomonadaceae bacterium]